MTFNFYTRTISTILILTAFASAQSTDAPPATQPKLPARAGHESSEPPASLRGLMNEMLDLLYNLKNESADPTNSEITLKDLAYLERDLAACKLHLPPSTNNLSPDEKPDAINSYRTMMSNLIRLSLDMEDAVAQKNPDQIKKLFTQIDKIEGDGHQKFISP